MEIGKYYAYVVEQALTNNIPFCAWDMKLIDRSTNTWSELKDILINTSGSANLSLDIKSFVHNDVLTVQLSGEFSNVSLYSLDGKQLVAFSTKAVEKDINLSKYKAGVYILRVSTSGSDLTTKVIIK